MAYEKMIPLLTEALQEQQKTIEELKQRIEVLENGIKYTYMVHNKLTYGIIYLTSGSYTKLLEDNVIKYEYNRMLSIVSRHYVKKTKTHVEGNKGLKKNVKEMI